MKTRMIKTLLISVASIMCTSNLWAQGIIVYKSDGTMEKISYAAIDSIVSYANDGNNGDEPKVETHEAVDLGLSVKWASCNVGATSPEDCGGYYAWGETEEKSSYYWEDYKYYNSSTGNFDYIGSNISGTSYDVAHVKWGGSWRMPTKDEIKELCNNCSWELTSVNGVGGQKVTGPNGNSIFLPAAGFRYGTEVYNRGSYGLYWSGTLDEGGSNNAVNLYFVDDYWSDWSNDGRGNGFSVRPVTD